MLTFFSPFLHGPIRSLGVLLFVGMLSLLIFFLIRQITDLILVMHAAFGLCMGLGVSCSVSISSLL